MELPSSRLPGLDGLRACSILLVVFGHLYFFGDFPVHGPFMDRLMPVLGNGHMGVVVFFVISGYLITFLLRREIERNGQLDLKAFYLRRVLRIFPALYAYVLCIAGLAAAGIIAIPRLHFALCAFFLANYAPLITHADNWFVGHLWSLSLEEQFYLLWPCVLGLLGIGKARRAALIGCLAMPLIRVVQYKLSPGSRGILDDMLHSGGDGVLWGCLLALYEREPAFESWVTRLSGAWVPTCAIGLAFVLVPLVQQHSSGVYFYYPFGKTLSCVAIATLLIWVVRHPASALGVVLNSRLMVFIGVLSYSLYLWQQLFLTQGNTTWLGVFPLNLAASFACAYGSYVLVEQPFLALKARRASGLSRPADIATG